MATAIGIDIGGTFIDVVIAEASGVRLVKIPSTPVHPADGVLRGLRRLVAEGRIVPGEVSRIAHGSTVATNALLEAHWARTALVMTAGFRDVLEIGRQNRESLYDLFASRRPVVVSRDLRFEVGERLDAEGRVVRPLDEAALRRIGEALRAEEVEAVAVVFLFSYLDSAHERRAREILAENLDIPIVLSSDVLPEFREYERTSTTVISAALRPVVGEYLAALERGAHDLGLPARWQVMQSSGAMTSAETAQGEPARILLSGPAGGIEGARAVGRLCGAPNLITMDMGGTSCDVAVIRGGDAGWTSRGEIGGYPVALPMVSIHTIGAGGGSIAWIDRGGALRVGPQSAGADPGPACYGRGGDRPTVTDAHVVLGHLLPDTPLGGLEKLYDDQACAALRPLAEKLGLTLEETALGILEVADASMERAIRVVSVERGHDPREYALLAFGGAGPLHGASIARRLSIPRVIVPAVAGVLSAYGLLVAETGHDNGQSVLRPLHSLSTAQLFDLVEVLGHRGRRTLIDEGVDPSTVRYRSSADLRYVGQSHELNVALPIEPGGAACDGAADTAAEAFHAMHKERFGHSSPEQEIELVTVRVRALAPATAVDLRGASLSDGDPVIRRTEAWFDASGPLTAPVIDRRRLPLGARLEGPAILIGEDSTIVVPPGVGTRKDEHGTVILEGLA